MSTPKAALLHFDGACRGNPGPAGAGYVLELGLAKFSRSVPMGRVATNNVAEYVALVAGLVAAQRLGVTHLRARGDSQLVVEQVLGRYRVREARLAPWRSKAVALAAGFESFDLAWVPREQNGRADHLARRALPDAVFAPTVSAPTPQG